MILPDVNVLLYATVDAFPLHRRAHDWWEGVLNSDRPVGLCDPVIFGFVRIVTNARIIDPALDVDSAAELVNGWLARRTVTRIVGGAGHIRTALDLLADIGTAGNLTTDAQIGALAMEHAATVHSTDADFLRFPAVRSVNPLKQRRGTAPPNVALRP